MPKYRVQLHSYNNTKDITASQGGIFFNTYQEAKYAAKCAADDKAAEVRNSVSWNGLEKFSKKHWAKVKFRRGKAPDTLYVSIEKQGSDYKLSGFYDITWQ